MCVLRFELQAASNKDMQRWIKDLEWRVAASESEIKRRFEPDRSQEVVRRRIDETEAGVFCVPERVMGLAVRYEHPQREKEADLED